MSKRNDVNPRRNVALCNQYRKAIGSPCDMVKYYMTDDVGVWYVLLSGFSGTNDEYVGGEYLCELTAPPSFPFNPPSFKVLTPNGVYIPDQKVCISIGEYHSQNYRAVLGMSGFAKQIISGIIGWKELTSGIGLTTTTIEEKKQFAHKSYDFNRINYPDIILNIEKVYAEYSAKWVAINTNN
jgi:ubiquitin-protein ligase